MTMKEYISQGGSKRAATASVKISDENIQASWWQGVNSALKIKARLIMLKEFGYTYRVDYYEDGSFVDGGVLWVMDDQGNKRARSVFRLKENN
jgi:hypothetical protein